MSSLTTTLAKVILIPLAAALSLVAWGPAVVPAQAAAPTAISATSTQVHVAAVKKYKMSTVKKHKTKKSCWTVVGTGVYDLTKWVKKHPGGQSRIIAMCGKNATKAFRAQHGSTGAAARALAKYKIGKLA